jgi:hypothetical protein
MPRISYFPIERLEDPEAAGYLRDSILHGWPGPEPQAIRAHVPGVLRTFTRTRRAMAPGVLDPAIKELCRVYVSQSLECHY